VTARSKRAHASGSNSTLSASGFFITIFSPIA
jgi:hypothetical protein